MFLSDSRRASGSDVSSQSCTSMIAAEMFSFSINRKASLTVAKGPATVPPAFL